MVQFEMVGIVRPDLEPDAVQGVMERIRRRVTDQGGTVDFTEVWGKRRLAYRIGKYREGVYFMIRFTVDDTRIPELTRLTRIMDETIRVLIVKAEGPVPARPERPAPAVRAEGEARGEPVMAPAEPVMAPARESSNEAQG